MPVAGELKRVVTEISKEIASARLTGPQEIAHFATAPQGFSLAEKSRHKAMEQFMTIWPMIINAVLVVTGIIIAVTDWRRGIIPDACNAVIALCGLLLALSVSPALLQSRIVDCVLTLLLFALVRYAYRRWRGYHGLGLGDVKFLGAAALCVGLTGVQILLFLACLSGLGEVFLRKFSGQSITKQSKVRFGPHLVLGFLVTLFLSHSGWDFSTPS
jgi:leader peptidase (prepilin peptidase) / N-methyltransferase